MGRYLIVDQDTGESFFTDEAEELHAWKDAHPNYRAWDFAFYTNNLFGEA